MVALTAMVVVFTPPAVSRGADADRAFSGNVTAFDDTPVVAQAGVRTTIDMVVHGSSITGNDTLSFTMHLAFQGIAYDDNDSSVNDICIGYDASVQDLALPVPHLSGDVTGYDAVSIPLSDISSSSLGCDQGSEPLPATGELELSLDGKGASGTITVDQDSIQFTAAPVGDTAITDFLSAKAVSADVASAVLAASACKSEDLHKSLDERPPECAAPAHVRDDFFTEFASSFKDQEILKDLSLAVFLRALAKPDGTRLLPTLNRLIKPIALLGIKADKDTDPDGAAQALTAMRRLINIAIAIDLEAAK